MTTSDAVAEARELPREPTAPWILTIVAVLTVAWLGVVAWQIAVLPESVATHFDSSGQADGWMSKPGAIATALLIPLIVVFPMPLMSRVALRWPFLINSPNREWWLATAPRLRRYERLMREDLWLIAAVTLTVLVMANLGITQAAIAGIDEVSSAYMWGTLAVLAVGIGAVIVRMMGGRYTEHHDLD